MNRLVDTVALALAIRQTTQTGRGQQTNATGDDTGLIADDVTEQVARHDDAVEGTRALDHQHSRRVDQLVLQLQLGKLLLEQLGDGLAPQPARGQHVGLVQAPDLGRRVLGQSQECRQTRNTLNLGAAVGLGVEREALDAVVLLALAEVDTTSQLTHDDEVSTAAHVGLEGRAVNEGIGGEAAGAQVSVGAELLAQTQDAGLRAYGGGGTPLGTTDGAEQDGIGGLGGVEGLFGQGVAVGIDGGLVRWLSVVWLNEEAVFQFGEQCCVNIAFKELNRPSTDIERSRLTPPKRCSCRLNLPAEGLRVSTALMTCTIMSGTA